MKKKIGMGLLGLIVIIAILQAVGIVKPEEHQTISPVTTESLIEEIETTVEEVPNELEEKTKPVSIEYDKLQVLYLQLNVDMSYDEIMGAILNSGLPYKDFGFNNMTGSQLISVAFDEKVLPDRYNDPGDKIEISFHEEDDILVISYIEYLNYIKFITAINNNTALNLERGLYMNDHVTVNGQVDYLPANSKEEQISAIISAPNYLDR